MSGKLGSKFKVNVEAPKLSEAILRKVRTVLRLRVYGC